jgi:hypothetical protein
MHSQKDVIGDVLDGAELFLQDPPEQLSGDQSVPYLNPHRLHNTAPGCGVMKRKIIYETDSLKQRFREVLDSACGPQHFAASQQSPRICTMLKP